jgi:hypothetical protein
MKCGLLLMRKSPPARGYVSFFADLQVDPPKALTKTDLFSNTISTLAANSQ